VNPRAPQGLISVNIAHPRDQGLVKKQAFDPRAPPEQGSHECVVVEVGVKGISGNVGDRGGNPAPCAVINQFIHREATEGALVYKTQVPASVGEANAHPEVGFRWTGLWHHKQLATHAQMRYEAGLLVVERQPQILAASTDACE
jgi:hypothetical protein